VSQDVNKKPQSEAGNQRLRVFHKTSSAKKTKCSRGEERTKDTCSPQKTATPQKQQKHLSLLNYPPHQLTQIQQRPV